MRLFLAFVLALLSMSSTTALARPVEGVPCARTGATYARDELQGHNGGLLYAQQRWLDPSTGRFLSLDPVAGALDEPLSTQGFTYAHGSPTRFTDPDGRSATLIGAGLGFVWGFGQMLGAIGNAAFSGNTHFGTFDALGIWTQNTIGGAEIGASIDIAALSGGMALPAAGALGNAGFDAITVGGEAQSAGAFVQSQGKEAAIGAILGPVFAKALPVVGGLIARIPGVATLLKAIGGAATAFTETRFGKWATTYVRNADEILPPEAAIEAVKIRGLLAEQGEESARMVAARAKAAASAAGTIGEGTIAIGLRPSSFGSNGLAQGLDRARTIADDPVLSSLWREAERAAAAGNNKYVSYLRKLANNDVVTNAEARGAFDVVNRRFSGLAKEAGIELPGPVHHWNFPLQSFPEMATDPRHLVPLTKAAHEMAHRLTNAVDGAVYNGTTAAEHVIR